MINNNDYVYSLVFKDKEAKNISITPLSFETPIDLKIPENTIWIELKVNRLTDNKQYERWTLYNLITKDILEENFNKSKDGYYITTSRFKYYPGFSNRSLILFNTKEELQKYIKSLIIFFHEHPYGQSNIEPKVEKKKNHTFSLKLTKLLNKNYN